jgi:hypothetical protein
LNPLRKKLWLLKLSLAFMALLGPTGAQAEQASEFLTITIENASPDTYGDIYVRRVDQDFYGDQALLGGHRLKPGQRHTFQVRLSPEPHDLLVLLEDGGVRSYLAIDFSVFRYLALGESGAELFEWDPAVVKTP